MNLQDFNNPFINKNSLYNDRYNVPNVTESNFKNYEQNNYKNVYSKEYNELLSLKQEPLIEYNKIEYYLTVSSKERDTTNYPSCSNYTTNLAKEFKNIYSIELIQCIIPDKNNVLHEPYLLLRIQELEDVMISNDINMSNAFAVLQLTSAVSSGYFINTAHHVHENTIKYFNTPKHSLNKMSISIIDTDGNIFDFGGSGSTSKEYQNTFIFRIVCLEKSTSSLQHRNVF